MIQCVQMREIAGYDMDMVFLVMPDESEFSRRVPLVIGTCMPGRIMNVIKESELVFPLLGQLSEHHSYCPGEEQ